MRNPNGYGTVYKQKGNRREPYVARVTVGWDVDPKTLKATQHRKVIGHFKTQAEARQALVDYHNHPLVFNQDATFAEVYEKWSEKKFETVGRQAIRKYTAAYKHAQRLHNLKMRDIQAFALQNVIDAKSDSPSMQRAMKDLFSAMFKFAIANQIIANGLNPAEYLTLEKYETAEHAHVKFSKDEIEQLFRHDDDPNVRVVLILIYTGMRSGELVGIRKEDVHDGWLRITHGKNRNAARDVPIHWAIQPYIDELMDQPGECLLMKKNGTPFVFDHDRRTFRTRVWDPALRSAGVAECEGGHHKPHDTRHTFTSLWKGQKLDEAFRRKIQGHSGDGIGEQVYMLPDIEDLQDELNKLWTPDDLVAVWWLRSGT